MLMSLCCKSVMQNDLANVIDAEEMVANYGPTSYMPELSLMSMLNNRLARLSTAPAYSMVSSMVVVTRLTC